MLIFVSKNGVVMIGKESISFFFSFRFLLALLIFIGVASEYSQKTDMGIGIVCMVNHTAIRDYISSSLANDEVCFHQPENGVSHVIDIILRWSNKWSVWLMYFFQGNWWTLWLVQERAGLHSFVLLLRLHLKSGRLSYGLTLIPLRFWICSCRIRYLVAGLRTK